MTIRIGTPTMPRAVTLGSGLASTLKVAGIATMALGCASMLGLVADMANYKEVAQAIYHMVDPVVNLTNSVYAGIGHVAGFDQAMSPEAIADTGLKVGASSVMMGFAGGVIALVQTKLSRAVEDARAEVLYKNDPPSGASALAKLRGFKNALVGVGTAPSRQTSHEPQEQEQPSMQMR